MQEDPSEDTLGDLDQHTLHNVKIFEKEFDKASSSNGGKLVELEELGEEVSKLTNAGWRITFFSSAFSEDKLVHTFVLELGPLIMKGPPP